jgi:hypothetical protein
MSKKGSSGKTPARDDRAGGIGLVRELLDFAALEA